MNKHGAGCSAGLDTQSRRDYLKVLFPGLASVLGYFQVAPSGLDLQKPSSHADSEGRPLQPFFHQLGWAKAWAKAHDSSGRDDKFIAPERLNCRSLGFARDDKGEASASIGCDGGNDNLKDVFIPNET